MTYMLNAEEIVQRAAEAADSKKASDILILDLRGLTSIADYFLICSCSNTTQVGAVADGIQRELGASRIHPDHTEGESAATWILMDYGDVVVHVFEDLTREHYSLERLWNDARRVPVAAPQPAVR